MEKLGDKRFEIFEECGFKYIEEFCHGVGIWEHDDLEYFLTAKPYGSFSTFYIISAETKEEALEAEEDYGVCFNVKNEEQIKTILKSL